MKKTLIIFSLFLVSFTTPVFAGYSNLTLKSSYEKIVKSIEAKYNLDKQYTIFSTLNNRIETILDTKELSSSNYSLINYLYQLNLEQLSKIETKKSDFIGQKDAELKQILAQQSLKEAILRNDLKNSLYVESIPNYINSIISTDRKLLFLNDKNEFINNDNIYKLKFTNYYRIDSANYNIFKTKGGYIVKKQGVDDYWFVETYSFSKKIAYSESKSYFAGFISSIIPFIEDNGNYYTYIFSNFNYLEDKYGFYLDDLKNNNLDTKKSILYLDENNRFNFITDYTKTKLISANILEGVINKWYFLKELVNDKKYLADDTDASFLELKEITNNITNGLSKDEKIEAIYSWILENIKYTQNIDLTDYRIYSGIKTFENNDGTCEGYTKLMAYMLMFSGFTDLEVIRGFVVNAPDFPTIGHAWLRLENKYYDPTFDDPIGANNTKTFEKYYYFDLPEDLFYTNRFLVNKLPEYLKSKTLSERNQFVQSNIYKYALNNPEDNYNLIKSANLKIKYGFGDNILTIDNLKEVLDFNILKDDFSIIESGEKKYIKTLKYILVTNKTLEYILEYNFNYNLDGLYLFNRQFSDGTNDYVLGYNLNFFE